MSITATFVELGEGFNGDFDPTDVEDVELLRLDLLPDGSNDPDDGESLCTHIPVHTPLDVRVKLLAKIVAFADDHPDWSLRHVCELFSWADLTWVNGDVPRRYLALFDPRISQ